ncbi:hypothetical protein [Bradyrhizobium ivorense]|uniref:hypothetical protein n=1 Tax=Bradyrhizobium ivorense TaxID=2511166 RepID=UPI0010B771D0|nr:hypothetical protein [Bradyrhizobium ivorense]VIO69846.1 hypothetical protein CI41S_20930 [Bradyrhizobium ivorense]
MLEKYYIRPTTIDRIHKSWIASAVEQYVGWMAERRYTDSSVSRWIPIVVSFGEFAKAHGAGEVKNLPDHVEPFVQAWIGERARRRSARRRKQTGDEVRNPIRQMLRLTVPDYIGRGRPHKPDNPFERQAPGLLRYLIEEKGLRQRSIYQYQIYLRQFAAYLETHPRRQPRKVIANRAQRVHCRVRSAPSVLVYGAQCMRSPAGLSALSQS